MFWGLHGLGTRAWDFTQTVSHSNGVSRIMQACIQNTQQQFSVQEPHPQPTRMPAWSAAGNSTAWVETCPGPTCHSGIVTRSKAKLSGSTHEAVYFSSQIFQEKKISGETNWHPGHIPRPTGTKATFRKCAPPIRTHYKTHWHPMAPRPHSKIAATEKRFLLAVEPNPERRL